MALDTISKQEGGKLKAVASGTLPSGQPVVVNSDGTVSVVTGSSISESFGSPTVFDGASYSITATYDASNQKVVLAYQDDGNEGYGTAVVGTVSGTSISFGTPVVFVNATAGNISSTYDSVAQKVVITYEDFGNTRRGTAIVGTVSGTSISFGSPTVFETSGRVTYTSATYDANAQKVVVSYRDDTNSNYGTSAVGTVSGTSISFGTPVIFNSGLTNYISSTYHAAAQKVVIAYEDDSVSDLGTAIVGTVSGTSISFGGEERFDGATQWTSCAYDSDNQKVIIAYQDQDNASYGTAVVATVSGTSITFGTRVVFESATTEWVSVAYDANAKKVVINYLDNGNGNYGTSVVGTVSGDSITFDSPVVFSATGTSQHTSVYDESSQTVVMAYQSTNGTAIVFQNASVDTNLTSENYIGMSGGAVGSETVTQSVGSEVVFETGSTLETACAFDSANNKVVIAYRDFGNSNYGTAIVGTVSGDSITFGSPVVFNSANTNNNSAVFDSLNNKIVISFQDSNGYGAAIVGTVSGTSISFGSKTTFLTATLSWRGATFDSNANKVVISYADDGNSQYGTAIVGTVSGTSISFGSPTVFESANTDNTAITFDSSNNKVVIAYQDAGNSNYGTCVVGTVSGTSISFGTPVVFESQDSDQCAITFDSNSNKVVIAYQDDGGDNSRYGTAIVGTVSGTSISFGSPVIFESANTDAITASFDSNANKVVIQYRDGGNSDYGTIVFGTVSGDAITFTSPTVFNTANTGANSSVFDSNANKVIIAYQDAGNSSQGTAVVVQAGYENIIRGQVADGDTATIDIVGTVSSNQASLTAGQQYYVQTDGTIGTTPADPSVLAGTAVSATKMVVKS